MSEAYIQSRQNEQIKNLVKLHERKHRDRQSCFLIEGLRELNHAIEAGIEILTIYFCPEHFPSDKHHILIDDQRAAGQCTLIRLSEEAFEKASHREGPDGLIALARQQGNCLEDLPLSKTPLLLIIEGIEKPGNLGAILRSADGAGIDAVILVDCVLDLYNPNAIRSSQGLIFALPIVHVDREMALQWLKQNNIHTIATTPSTEKLHWNVDYRESTALLMGSESHGLSDFWLENASERIRIPMLGQADSLNIAAATALCLYEARRQRGLPELPA